ncbi:MAG: hypothetical protein OIF40_13860 [Mangrovicoccus sp.]|nr:hypothetical protein [Mangrovicoccus sp.]
MSLHMITDFDTPDFPLWQQRFESRKAGLAGAGLHLQRVLHLPQSPAHVWVEFDVEDQARARSWLETSTVSEIKPIAPLSERHRFLEMA